MIAGGLHAEIAEPKGYLIENWQTDRGLPQTTVTGIAQRLDGYLWISTLDGLARFDGVRFRIYKSASTPELGSGRIRFLFPGQRDDFWVSNQEGGLTRCLNDWQYISVSLPGQAPRPAVVQLAQQASGTLWISTEDGKVARLENGVHYVVSTNWDFTGKTAYHVRQDVRGRLLAVSDRGFYEPTTNGLVPLQEGRRGEFVVRCAAREGGWWVSTGTEIRLWRDGQWLTRVAIPDLARVEIRSALEDRAGYLWLGTWGSGLVRCATNGMLMRFTKKHGLGGDFVRALCEDHEGSLWVGAEGGGLSRLRRSLFTVYGLAPGLSWDWITSVSEGPDGTLWVGTDGYGLNSLRDGVIAPAFDAPVTAPMHVMTALADRTGQVWLGTRLGNIYQWDHGKPALVQGQPKTSSFIRCFYEDGQGAIWVGRRDTHSLLKIHEGTVGQLELPKSAGPLDVRTIVEDGTGGLWIGTDGSGLFHWRNGKFTRYTRENGLSSDLVWALQPEPDGSLWIGTFGGGLTRLKDGEMVTCSTQHGLPDDVICYIADDKRGRYWLSSHQGVVRVDKDELAQFANGTTRQIHCVAYGKSDGLPSLECRGGYQPAGARGRNGRLWFPTVNGVVVVNPADTGVDDSCPPVYLEEISVDGKLFRKPPGERAKPKPGASDGLATSRAARSSKPTLAFPAGSRRFEFHYAGVSINTPEGLRFRHRLDGVDADWVETGQRRETSYTRLPYGTYTFRVQTSNRKGQWGRPGDQITFRVLPFFWQTGWFAGAFLLVFGGGVAWGVGMALKQRHRRHLKMMEQLHAAERERTRIARDIHDDLGSSLTEISLMGALAMRDITPPAEARDQIARMIRRTEELTRKLDETVWAVKPENDSLRHLSTYLCNFAREFLEPANIRCRLDMPPSPPEVPLSTEARHNMFLVAKEALNNAVKHSGATEIDLRMQVSPGEVKLEIADNGRGFAADTPPGTGNGLKNMAFRMQDIGGRLEVRSRVGEGTVIAMRIPLKSGIPAILPRTTPLGDGAEIDRS